MENPHRMFETRHFDAGSRVGRFYSMLDKENLFAKSDRGFTFNHPHGIVCIKPDIDSIRRFLGIAFQLNLVNGSDESILKCTTDSEALKRGEPVTWESERYSKKSPGMITLADWLQAHGVSYEAPKKSNDPLTVIEGGRGNIETTLARTGTFEGL